MFIPQPSWCLFTTAFLAIWVATGVAGELERPDEQVAVDAEEGTPVSEAATPEAAKLFAEAGELQNAGKLEAALRAWRKFLETHADDPLQVDARHYLGICLLQQQEYASASKQLVQVIDRSKDARLQEEALVSLAWCHYSLGATTNIDAAHTEKAIKYFQRHTEEYPQSTTIDDSYFYIGECNNLLQRHDKAADAYRVVIERYPDSVHCPNALVSAAYAASASREFQQAVAYLDRVQRDFPDRAAQHDARLAHADALTGMHRFADAERVFSQLASHEDMPTLEYVMFRQADCLEQLERFAEAGDVFRSVAEMFPKSESVSMAAIGAARNYVLAAQLSDAEELLIDALKTSGAHTATARHWMVQVLIQSDRAREAVVWARETMDDASLAPNQSFRARLDLVEAECAAAGKPPELFARFDELLKENQAGSGDQAIAATIPEGERRLQIIRAAVRAAIATEATEALARYGQLLVADSGDDPQAAMIERLIVNHQLVQGRFEAAADRLAGMISRYPSSEELEMWHLQLAASQYRLGKYAESLETAQYLVDRADRLRLMDPSEVFCVAGAAELKLGNADRAVTAFDRGLAATPQPATREKMLLQIAEAHQQLNNPKAAGLALQRLLDDEPLAKQPAVERPIKLALAALAGIPGDRQTAARMYKQLRETAPEAAITTTAELERAWLAFRNEDFEAAEEDFAHLVTTHQNDANSTDIAAEAYYGRALARRGLGRPQEALDDLAAYFDLGNAQFMEDALTLKADCELTTETWKSAAATLAHLIAEFPTAERRDQALSHLVLALCKTGSLDDAADRAEQLGSKFPNSPWLPEAWQQLADAQFESSQFADASASYLQVVSASDDPSVIENACYRRGWALFQAQQYELATTVFENLREQYPKGSLVHRARFMQAESLFKLRRYQHAVPHYEQLSSGGDLRSELAVLTLLHGSECYRHADQHEKAAAWLERIVTEHRDSVYVPKSLYELGQTYVRLKQPAVAIKYFTSATKSGSAEIAGRSHYSLGRLYASQQDFNEALQQFRRLMHGFDTGSEQLTRLAPWRARAGLEAARCYDQLAARARLRQKRSLMQEKAKSLRFVVESFPETQEAQIAKRELQRLRLAMDSLDRETSTW